MAWPTNPVAVGDIITAAQLNLLPIQIATSTLSGTASQIDLTSLPAFSNLMIVLRSRSTAVANQDGLNVRCNGDTGAHYDSVGQSWFGSTANNNFAANAGTALRFADVPAANVNSNVFGTVTLMIPRAGLVTTGYKTMHSYGVSFASLSTASQYEWLVGGGVWESTAAINELTFALAAGSFAAGSSVTAYGMP